MPFTPSTTFSEAPPPLPPPEEEPVAPQQAAAAEPTGTFTPSTTFSEAPAPAPQAAPSGPGPVETASNAVGGFVQEHIVEPASQYVPKEVQQAAAPVMDAAGNVGQHLAAGADEALGALGAGDIGGAAGAVFGTAMQVANLPFEQRTVATGEEARREQTIGVADVITEPWRIPELLSTAYDDPSRIEPLITTNPLPQGVQDVLAYDPVTPLANALGARVPVSPTDYLVGGGERRFGSSITDFAAAHPDIPEDELYEAWLASGGVERTPAGVDSPLDDEQYSGTIVERAGQFIPEAAQFAGSVVDAARQGQLGPFLAGMEADLMHDPTVPAQIALGIASGGTSLAAGAASKAGLPAVARGLNTLTHAGRTINRAGDLVTDPALNTVSAVVAPAVGRGRNIVNAIPGVRTAARAFDPAESARTHLGGDVISEVGPEVLGLRRAAPLPPATAPTPPVTPGAPSPPTPNGAQAAPTPDPRQPAGVAPSPSTRYRPQPGVTARPATGGRADPYQRPVMTAANRAGAAPTTGANAAPPPRPNTPPSREAIAVRSGRWLGRDGQPLTERSGMAPASAAMARRMYDEMLVASPDAFWERFDAFGPHADVPLGDTGLYARWRAAMRQGLYLLDDWPASRTVAHFPDARNAAGGIDWPRIEALAREGDVDARRALGGERHRDLYVTRIMAAPDPDREVYNLIATYHLDQHSGRFAPDQFGPAYWRRRAEGLGEIVAEAGYVPSPRLMQRLSRTDLGDLLATEFPARPVPAKASGKPLAANGQALLYQRMGDPVVLTAAPPAPPGTPTRGAQLSAAAEPPPTHPPGLTPERERTNRGFGTLSARHRNRIMAEAPPDVAMDNRLVPMSGAQKAAMDDVQPFRFRDRTEELRLGDALGRAQEDVEAWAQLAADPTLRASTTDAAFFARLTTRFGGDGLDPVALTPYQRDLLATDVVREAWEKARPTKEPRAGMLGAVGDINQSYLTTRRRIGLYNWLNIPRFALMQHAGNAMQTGVAGAPMRGLRIFFNIGAYFKTYRHLRDPGKVKLFSDDLQATMGAGSVRGVLQSDRAALGDALAGKPAKRTGAWATAGRAVAPDSLVNIGKISDTYAPMTTFADEVFRGYRAMNAALPGMVREWSRKYGLPYTDAQLDEAITGFLSRQRTIIDGNTGEPHRGLFGRVDTYTPVYSAEEFRAFLREELPKIAPPTSTIVADPLEKLIRRAGADVAAHIKQTQTLAKGEMERIHFTWRSKNIDEAAQNVFMYHYWMTRAGGLYTKQMLTHPYFMAAYGRLMDDFEAQADLLDAPDWLKGFFQFMNTPAGFSVWMSPFDLLSTVLTFADWQMETSENPFLDLTWLGKQKNAIPWMLNPLLDFLIYAAGGYGPDGQIPDLLGVNRMVTMSTDLLNLANANGYLPAWVGAAGIGRDAMGNPIPIHPRPLSELYARVGHQISMALRAITGLRPVPVRNLQASQSVTMQLILEQDMRAAHPGLSQDEIDRMVTAALHDPGAPAYQAAYQKLADLPFMADARLPGFVQGAIRAVSPFQITAFPEQKLLDGPMKGYQPTGEIPGRNPGTITAGGVEYTFEELQAMGPDGQAALIARFPEAEQQIKILGYDLSDAKYGGRRTLEGRTLAEAVEDSFAIGDPDIEAIKDEGWRRKDEHVAATGDEGAAYDVRDAYWAEHGLTPEDITAHNARKTAYMEEHPEVDAYFDWKYAADDHPGGEMGYIGELMVANSAYNDYIQQNGIDPETGAINAQAALSTDAYLAAQGVRPTHYAPLNEPMGISPPPSELPQVTPTTQLTLRDAPEGNALMYVDPGMPMSNLGQEGEWMLVQLGEQQGYVHVGYLQNVPNQTGGGIVGAMQGVGNALGGVGEMVGSLMDASGAIVGSMVGLGQAQGVGVKPSLSGVPGKYSIIPAPDGIGIRSSPDDDRTWIEDMIGPWQAVVTGDYKSQPFGPWYSYQVGHGADETTHAAYDISCDTGDCIGTPIFAPMPGTVVCAGYGQGQSTMPGASCNYSEGTTSANPDGTPAAHTVVIDVGVDPNGNPVQLSFNHMGTSDLVPGQGVDVGDLLGGMGTTAYGPHIHLEGWGICPSTGTYHILDPALIVGGYYFANPIC